MTTTYGGYTVQQLREFIAHTFNTEHGGDTIDELAGDTAASANIVRDLLDAIEPPHGGDLLAPVACWVYSAVRVNLDLLHAICTEFGCQQGDDVAQWLRARLAASPVEQPAAAPIELSGVKETLETGDGFWRSCSGCHETCDGHPVGEYPYSAILKCDLGAGCSECGGIGAVWDNTDYAAMGDAFERAGLLNDTPAPSPADERAAFEAWWYEREAFVLRAERFDTPDAAARAAWEARGATTAAASTPAGWKLVPVEPTDEMITAGISKGDAEFYGDALVRAEVRSDYQVMLTAAPAFVQAAEPVAIYQILTEEGAWLDVPQRIYEKTKSDPTLTRVVYAAPQPPAQAVLRDDHVCHDGEDCHACDAEHAAQADAREEMTYQDGLRAALNAVSDEHLQAPTEEHGDVVYDRAVGDCENAIRDLLQGANHAE